MNKLGDVLAHPEELVPLVRRRATTALCKLLEIASDCCPHLHVVVDPHIRSQQEGHEAAGGPEASLLL